MSVKSEELRVKRSVFGHRVVLRCQGAALQKMLRGKMYIPSLLTPNS